MLPEDRQKKHIHEIFDQYVEEEEEKEDDDEEEEESDSDDEGKINDDFLDYPIDFTAEILKAKKTAAFSKKTNYKWSGQEILCDYDP